QRNIADAGALSLNRAQTGDEAARSLTWLEAQQAERWEGTQGRYRLDQPAYGRFYRAVLERGVEASFADVFTLLSGEVPVGAVFRIHGANSSPVLRIASDDAPWGGFSRGRIPLITVMEHLVARGVRPFDLGIGDYEFKRRLGAEPHPLTDLTAPLSWSGIPAV